MKEDMPLIPHRSHHCPTCHTTSCIHACQAKARFHSKCASWNDIRKEGGRPTLGFACRAGTKITNLPSLWKQTAKSPNHVLNYQPSKDFVSHHVSGNEALELHLVGRGSNVHPILGEFHLIVSLTSWIRIMMNSFSHRPANCWMCSRVKLMLMSIYDPEFPIQCFLDRAVFLSGTVKDCRSNITRPNTMQPRWTPETGSESIANGDATGRCKKFSRYPWKACPTKSRLGIIHSNHS